MINLLPDAYKKTIDHEHWLRVIATNCLFFCYLAAMSLVLFFPSYVLTKIRADEARVESQALQVGDGTTDVSKTIRELGVAATKARELSSRLTTTSLHDVLHLLEGKPAGIRVVEISYVNHDGVNQLILKGIAQTREALTSFNKFLSGQSQLSAVDIPISNFAKDRNFEFTATVTIKPTS